jgi:hypothetical protein
LAWKLAAVLEGWGGPGLLGSYEIERRQVGERNVAASTYASRGRRAWRAEYRPCLRDNTPEGAAARTHLARFAEHEQRKSNEMIGAELGYRYVGSPIIWPEPGEGPPHEFIDYVPSTWPGARLPHAWLEDGTALHDRIGDGFTLLRLGGTRADSAEGLAHAMRATGAPLDVLDVADETARAVYGCDLLLVRPDLHVAWRGNEAPAQSERLAAIVTGRIANSE